MLASKAITVIDRRVRLMAVITNWRNCSFLIIISKIINIFLERHSYDTSQLRHARDRRRAGRDVHFWWSLLRLDTSPLKHPLGRLFAHLSNGPGPRVLDAGIYRQALAAGKPDTRPMFQSFTENGVIWTDGSIEEIDAVIFATGYRAGLNYLAPLGALDSAGQPLHRHGVSTVVPGLGFVGLANQRTFASASLRGVGADAAVVIRALHRQAAWHPLKRFWQRAPCCTASASA